MITKLSNRPHSKNPRGFTMLELALSLTFISVLLLSAALIIFNITSIYQKGISLRAIDATGRELIDEFSRSISASPTISLKTYCKDMETDAARTACEQDNATKYVYREIRGDIEYKDRFGTVKKITVPLHGAFCTGRFSYIWNTGYALGSDQNLSATEHPYKIISVNGKADGEARARYDSLSVDPEENRNFRLLKISDTNRTLCAEHINKTDYKDDGGNSYSGDNPAEEMLSSSEANLALFDLTFFKPAQHTVTRHSFYSGTFVLATMYGPIDITGSGEFCTEAAANFATDFSYCALNKFNFAMRAEGEAKK